MSLTLTLNGQPKLLDSSVTTLAELVSALGFQADRIAIEHNGVIVPRSRWAETPLSDADRIELVHFVGGGVPVNWKSSLSHRSP